jgi:hypothetical protein
VILRAIRFSVFFISLVSAFAQPPALQPVTLEQMTDLLANRDFAEIPEIEGLVRQHGIAFDVETELPKILEATAKGERNPTEVAALLRTSLKACQACRARALEPLTVEDIKLLRTWRFSDAAITQEGRIRGVKGLEISEPAANELRAAGATDDLISFLMPDDQMPTIPRDGYQPLELRHAEEFDPSAANGWIKVDVNLPANSQSEFVFVHTGLFVEALKGDLPIDVTAYFNKPAPRKVPEELVDYDSRLDDLDAAAVDEKRSGFPLGIGGRKPKPVDPGTKAVHYSEEADGHNAFVFQLGNNGTVPQHFSFALRWQVLTAPKEKPAPAPVPAKKK